MITKVSFILVILSGIIHPLWNMLLKKSDDKVVFYLNIHLIYTVLFSFILILYPVSSIDLSGWFFVILSAFAHFFYQVFLCRTYELADMSLTYPIVRSSPIFVLLMGFVFLKEIPSLTAAIGVIIVMAGVLIIHQKTLSFSFFKQMFRNIDTKVMVVAVLTAFSSACYAIVDKKGVLMLHPVLFFYLMFAFSGFLFLIYFLFLKERRGRYFEILARDKYRITLAAILEFSSYILILYAFRISKVAYIVSLRQISVVFGVLYGIRFLDEKYGKVRFVGSLIIFCGIFLITAFG
ncbi:MAG: EamA family transporter [Deltaproteobacteria bacterium]|nr:EamA family transporter [Deltaproteobacteria bacterium]